MLGSRLRRTTWNYVRKDFPILERRVHDGVPLVYLDSANTSQKPRQVLDVLNGVLRTTQLQHPSGYPRAGRGSHRGLRRRAHEGRGVHWRGQPRRSGLHQELVRGTQSRRERASPWGVRGHQPGDEVVITEMEHHSNIVPWQLLCQRTGATLRWFGVTDDGRLDLSNIDDLINPRTKVVSFVHVSNILGTLNPVRLYRRPRACARRARRTRRVAVGAASAGRRPGPWC